jgi:hypothetical protein
MRIQGRNNSRDRAPSLRHDDFLKLNDTIAAISEPTAEQFRPVVEPNSLSAARFVTAFPDVVPDKHTELVWEETPDLPPNLD